MIVEYLKNRIYRGIVTEKQETKLRKFGWIRDSIYSNTHMTYNCAASQSA